MTVTGFRGMTVFKLSSAAAFAAGSAIQFGYARLFLVNNFLRELAHKATTDVFVDHGSRTMRVADVTVRRMMMPM